MSWTDFFLLKGVNWPVILHSGTTEKMYGRLSEVIHQERPQCMAQEERKTNNSAAQINNYSRELLYVISVILLCREVLGNCDLYPGCLMPFQQREQDCL
jgi:hypothetical protein